MTSYDAANNIYQAEPRVLRQMTAYDVASNICLAQGAGKVAAAAAKLEAKNVETKVGAGDGAANTHKTGAPKAAATTKAAASKATAAAAATAREDAASSDALAAGLSLMIQGVEAMRAGGVEPKDALLALCKNAKVGRCRLTLSNPWLKPPGTKRLQL
jgi:hypothetical protein